MPKKKKTKSKAGKKRAIQTGSQVKYLQEFKPKSNLSKRMWLLAIIGLVLVGYALFKDKFQLISSSPKLGPKVEETITITPTLEITGETYTVRVGDTLKSIARRAYGDENVWVKIAQANKLRNPNRIEIGWVLRLPR